MSTLVEVVPMGGYAREDLYVVKTWFGTISMSVENRHGQESQEARNGLVLKAMDNFERMCKFIIDNVTAETCRRINLDLVSVNNMKEVHALRSVLADYYLAGVNASTFFVTGEHNLRGVCISFDIIGHKINMSGAKENIMQVGTLARLAYYPDSGYEVVKEYVRRVQEEYRKQLGLEKRKKTSEKSTTAYEYFEKLFHNTGLPLGEVVSEMKSAGYSEKVINKTILMVLKDVTWKD